MATIKGPREVCQEWISLFMKTDVCLNPKQLKFIQWQHDSVESIDVLPAYDVLPRRIFNGLQDKVVIYPKGCYRNAVFISRAYPKINVCLGLYYFEKFPMVLEHAWNEYNGQYFDLTAECCLTKNMPAGYGLLGRVPRRKFRTLLSYSLQSPFYSIYEDVDCLP